MAALVAFAGAVLIALALWNVLEAVTPKPIAERFCLTKRFFLLTWRVWSAVARRMRPGKRRDFYLSVYSPLSILLLVALWAGSLVLGFAKLHWSLGSQTYGAERSADILLYVRMSASTLFPFITSSVKPDTSLVRVLIVAQSAMGFIFFAVAVAYLLTLYRDCRRRATIVSLIEEMVGAPPSVVKLLRGRGDNESLARLDEILRGWEKAAAELMVSNDSYPHLSYCRSPRDQKSWLATLTIVMDTSAMVVAATDGAPAQQAKHTFSMARRVIAGSACFHGVRPLRPDHGDRHLFSNLAHLRAGLSKSGGAALRDEIIADEQLIVWQETYEPYVFALSDYFMMPLPVWESSTRAFLRDAQQTTAYRS